MIYADTSVLVSFYKPDAATPRALALLGQTEEPLAWTGWHRIEFGNALQLARFRTEIDDEDLARVHHARDEDACRGMYRACEVPPERLEARVVELSDRWTASLGTRTLDIVHVALALELGIERFVSFDDRQRKLAAEVGLDLND